MANRRLIVGVSGASGAPVTIELLQQLQTEKDLEVHLICSKWGLATLEHEAGVTRQDLEGLCTRAYDEEDRGAAPASGSFSAVGMAVVPCSMKTLAGISPVVAGEIEHYVTKGGPCRRYAEGAPASGLDAPGVSAEHPAPAVPDRRQ